VLGVGACGFEPQIAEGAFACGADRSCPNGFVCAGDNKCYRPGNGPPVPTIDGGPVNPDGAPPFVPSNLQADPITLPEGNGGTTDFVFTIRLDPPSSREVTVDYTTNDGTAKVNEDFAGASGRLIFPPGSTSQTVTVKVNGDRFEEPDETFKLTLANPQNAKFLDGAGPEIIATIKNDDAPGLAIDDITVTEGDQDTVAALTVSLSGTYAAPVTVNYETLAVPSGTMSAVLPATEGADFIATSDVLTFAPGEQTKTINVPIKGDFAHERAEEFYVKLTNPVGAPMVDDQATVTINDNDPVPTLSIANTSISEGDDSSTPANMTFAVTLTAPSGEEIKVNFATGGGTASNADYATTTGTLTFPPGSTTQYATVPITGDLLDEVDETLDVTLSTPVNATIAKATATGTIIDDDGAPILTVQDVATAEGAAGTTKMLTFDLVLSTASAKTITVTYTTAGGTATSGTDFVAATVTVTFMPGETTKPANITINGDNDPESTETFTLNLTNPTNVTLAAASAIGTILNDDGNQATFAIADATPTVEGNSGTKVFTFAVTCTGSLTSPTSATVAYATANGTATAGSDFVTTSGTLTFNTCPSTQNVSVTVNGDAVFEPNETFTVNLSNATGNTGITDSQGVGTIQNDDTAPIISIATPTPITEGNTGTKTLSFTVTLSKAASTAVTVSYATSNATATAGSDYVSASGTVTFAAGDTSETVNVTINGDTVFEPNETFNVTLSNASANATLVGGTSTAVGTINNDDARPTISINDVIQNEGNNGSANFVFTVSLTAPTYEPVTVSYATSNGTAEAGTDYTAKTGSVTIPAGSVSTTIAVSVNGDAVSEVTETFNVTLSAPTAGYTISDPTGLGTITNDDQAHLITISDVSQNEGTSLTFTLTMSPGSNGSTSVDWNLVDITTSPNDHQSTVSGTVNFSNGQTSKTITITTTGDTLDELDETFEIRLSNVQGDATLSDAVGVGTIVDNDATPTITIANAQVTEGNTGTKTMTFNVTLSAVSGQDVSVSWATEDGSAKGTGQPASKDFEGDSNTITWTAGDTQLVKTITITVYGDTIDEGASETFTVELTNAVHATITGSGVATGTINDDD
jgi:large repetitive protein